MLISQTNNLCFSSYNSTGFGPAAQNYLETILLFSDIIAVQEHFLLNSKDKNYSNTNKLRKAFGANHDMYIVPAYRENLHITRGRGKGGLATIWKKTLTKYVSKVECNNPRIQATKFSFPDCPLLFINSYFPCDPQSNSFDDTELINLLQDLQTAIRASNCVNVILAGDLNCHFSRLTKFTETVAEGLSNLRLKVLWQNTDNDPNHLIMPVDYTYLSVTNNVATCSIIDHFATSSRLYSSVTEAGVLHSGENISNHSAIYMKINLGKVELSLENEVRVKKISWDKATDDAKIHYSSQLETLLQNIPIPECISCSDLCCTGHREELENYTLLVLEAVEHAAKLCLPSTGGVGISSNRKTNVVAGWSEFVKPYADESKFWSSVWKSQGKPIFGQVFENMKLSKTQYKYAVRRLKRCNDAIQNRKFLSSLEGGGCNIFKEIRKYRGQCQTYSSRIDEEVGSANIASHFAGIYSELYNRVENNDKLQQVDNRINSSINFDSRLLDKIDEKLILNSLKKLKSSKRDAIFDTISDCYINGPPALVHSLCQLVRSFVSHGYMPIFTLVCTLQPLVKDNFGDITASNNYRAIAGGCLLLKLVDIVILALEGDKLKFSELQFAYQAETSTTVCSWAVTSVINYFNNRGAAVYGAAMDMSKAFDMVEWAELFTTLLDRKINSLLLRLMLFIYRNQSCTVKWQDK